MEKRNWKEEEEKEKKYQIIRKIGKGAFGIVNEAQDLARKETVAIKKLLFTTRRKDNEVKILLPLRHPNITNLRDYYYSRGVDFRNLYINLVLDFLPAQIDKVIQKCRKEKTEIPGLHIKLYCYQMCRAICYLHSLGICHRDIKPGNLLVDPESQLLKLCDFGNACFLKTGKEDTSDMCFRYYRPPELLVRAQEYTLMVDIWAMGCVFAEFFTQRPLFLGETTVNTLISICEILGVPDKADIQEMKAEFHDFKGCSKEPKTLKKLLATRAPPEAIDLIEKVLQFNPANRLKPFEVLLHPYFDELRDSHTRLPNGKPLPELFNFDEQELKSVPPEFVKKLFPKQGPIHNIINYWQNYGD